jgi:uncharacterized membrane protein YeiH
MHPPQTRENNLMPATEIIETTLILTGVFAFALSGALLAVREKFDIVGMAVLATVTAVGGGVIRDVLIGDIPPSALTDPWSLLLPLAATVLTFFFHPRVARMGRTVQLFDAIGLGVFCATATTKAADTGISPMAAVLLGTITGVGGGIVRDVLAGQTPSVLRRDSRLYAIPAVAGSTLVAVAFSFGYSNTVIQGAAAAAICGFRLLALRYKWHAPVPVFRPRT